MRRRRKAARSALALWADTVASGMATASTLSVRLPQLAAGTMSDREARRMVAEKVAAATEGAVEGSFAMARIAMRAPRLVTPFGLLDDAMSVAAALSAPARRTVKANAKRLSAKRSKGRS